jgi:hypothetical protein
MAGPHAPKQESPSPPKSDEPPPWPTRPELREARRPETIRGEPWWKKLKRRG